MLRAVASRRPVSPRVTHAAALPDAATRSPAARPELGAPGDGGDGEDDDADRIASPSSVAAAEVAYARAEEHGPAHRRGLVLLNLAAALFGSNQVAIKLAEHDLSAGGLQLGRFAVALACFAPAALRGLRQAETRRAAAELGLYLFGGYAMQAEGLELTTASRGAFTGTFTVLLVPLLSGLVGRPVPATTWAAGAVAVTGVALLTNSGGLPNAGDAWCIASALAFGVHKFRTEALTRRAPETGSLMATQILVLTALSLVCEVPELTRIASEGGVPALLDSAAALPWPLVAYMGLFTTAFTLYAEVEALKTVSAPLAALIYTAEPLWGAGIAYYVLGERWGALGWVGAALIIASSVSAQLGTGASEEDAAANAPNGTE